MHPQVLLTKIAHLCKSLCDLCLTPERFACGQQCRPLLSPFSPGEHPCNRSQFLAILLGLHFTGNPAMAAVVQRHHGPASLSRPNHSMQASRALPAAHPPVPGDCGHRALPCAVPPSPPQPTTGATVGRNTRSLSDWSALCVATQFVTQVYSAGTASGTVNPPTHYTGGTNNCHTMAYDS